MVMLVTSMFICNLKLFTLFFCGKPKDLLIELGLDLDLHHLHLHPLNWMVDLFQSFQRAYFAFKGVGWLQWCLGIWFSNLGFWRSKQQNCRIQIGVCWCRRRWRNIDLGAWICWCKACIHGIFIPWWRWTMVLRPWASIPILDHSEVCELAWIKLMTWKFTSLSLSSADACPSSSLLGPFIRILRLTGDVLFARLDRSWTGLEDKRLWRCLYHLNFLKFVLHGLWCEQLIQE